MRKAVFITAFNRPEFLKPVVESWAKVRVPKGWDLFLVLEPSNRLQELLDASSSMVFTDIFVNDRILGAPENPYRWMERLLNDDEFPYGYVVQADDDLLVSEDILEFHDWASRAYRNDPHVLTVCPFTHENGEEAAVKLLPGFKSWVWGTWRDRWIEHIGPTWDHNYETHNGTPGVEAGWDWNINTRLIPRLEAVSVFPRSSRVQNIGSYGVHAQPADFETTESFVQYRGSSYFFEE